MRYFLTGATGFIGGRLAARLLRDGHDVTALVRNPERAHALTAAGARIANGDITEPDGLAKAMDGCDGAFHLAAWYRLGPRGRSSAEPINVCGTRNVLDAVRAASVPKCVYTSTVAVFSDTHGAVRDETYRFTGTHVTEYDRTKALAHYEVAVPAQEAGLPLVIVQPGLVYGPGDPSAVGVTLRQYLRRRLPLVPAGAAYCWAHVDDIVDGHVRAMERGREGAAYILAGPAWSLVDALALAEAITGVKAPRIIAPPGLLKAAAALSGIVDRWLPLPDVYTGEGLRAVAGATYLGSSARAHQELGFQCRPLEEGLRETLAAERGTGR